AERPRQDAALLHPVTALPAEPAQLITNFFAVVWHWWAWWHPWFWRGGDVQRLSPSVVAVLDDGVLQQAAQQVQVALARIRVAGGEAATQLLRQTTEGHLEELLLEGGGVAVGGRLAVRAGRQLQQRLGALDVAVFEQLLLWLL